MKIAACLSSANVHYCTPPELTRPTNRLLVPKGSGRTLFDGATNDAAIKAGLIRATYTCDGTPEGGDGLTADRSVADAWIENPPYGSAIKEHVANLHHWGRERGMPGILIAPNRGAKWAHDYVYTSADAWLIADRRFIFWRPVPIRQLSLDEIREANPDLEGEKLEKAHGYNLRRWFMASDEEDLPDPFRCIGDNWAIGPELALSALKNPDNVKPWQHAPFDTIVAFWADPDDYGGPVLPVRGGGLSLDQTADGDWVLFDDDGAVEQRVGERVARSWIAEFGKPPKKVEDHPINVREFVRHFGHLGTIVVARGPYAGVYRRAVA